MKRANVIIIATCTAIILSELSAQGQLVFGFPFISESITLFKQIPDSATKIRTTLHTDIDTAYANTELPDIHTSTPNTKPENLCEKLKFSEFQAAQAALTKSRQDLEKLLGHSDCVKNNQTIYDNGQITLSVTYEGDVINGIQTSPSSGTSEGISYTGVRPTSGN